MKEECPSAAFDVHYPSCLKLPLLILDYFETNNQRLAYPSEIQDVALKLEEIKEQEEKLLEKVRCVKVKR